MGLVSMIAQIAQTYTDYKTVQQNTLKQQKVIKTGSQGVFLVQTLERGQMHAFIAKGKKEFL